MTIRLDFTVNNPTPVLCPSGGGATILNFSPASHGIDNATFQMDVVVAAKETIGAPGAGWSLERSVCYAIKAGVLFQQGFISPDPGPVLIFCGLLTDNTVNVGVDCGSSGKTVSATAFVRIRTSEL